MEEPPQQIDSEKHEAEAKLEKIGVEFPVQDLHSYLKLKAPFSNVSMQQLTGKPSNKETQGISGGKSRNEILTTCVGLCDSYSYTINSGESEEHLGEQSALLSVAPGDGTWVATESGNLEASKVDSNVTKYEQDCSNEGKTMVDMNNNEIEAAVVDIHEERKVSYPTAAQASKSYGHDCTSSIAGRF